MFGDYSIGDLGSIFVMQGFAGLILFSVYVLMALGLAIIFGQMGVINMAHGEFMILGAYMTFLCSRLFEAYFPSLYSGYFFFAMAVALIDRKVGLEQYSPARIRDERVHRLMHRVTVSVPGTS